MFKKSIVLHNNNLIVELTGESKYSDIMSIKRKIVYLANTYNVDHVIIDLKNSMNSIDYMEELIDDKTILLYEQKFR